MHTRCVRKARGPRVAPRTDASRGRFPTAATANSHGTGKAPPALKPSAKTETERALESHLVLVRCQREA